MTQNPNKIETMRRAGKILGEVLEEVINSVRPGITEIELDALAEKRIREKGGEPGFKKVPGYKHTICISVNHVVVHGIPTKRVLRAGDEVGIDCGVFLEGYHTDMAETIIVINKRSKIRDQKFESMQKFLQAGKAALWAGIRKAKAGNRVGHISHSMQHEIEVKGYSVVRNLVGHGVGEELHMSPDIPGYLAGSIMKTPLLNDKQTVAIEIIYNMGNREVAYEGSDDWTIVTQDGSLSGLFERSILVTEAGSELLCRLSSDPLDFS